MVLERRAETVWGALVDLQDRALDEPGLEQAGVAERNDLVSSVGWKCKLRECTTVKIASPGWQPVLIGGCGLLGPNVPWHHPLQDSVPHDQRVKQYRPKVSDERQEKEVGKDGVRLP
jgi:hypothetical protein